MSAFLFLVNPTLAYDPYPDWAAWEKALARGARPRTRWNTGTRRRGMSAGDKALIARVGTHPKGVIGVGEISSQIWVGPHWNPEAARPETGFVELLIDAIAPVDDPLTTAELALIAPGVNFGPRQSGTEIPETAWRAVADIFGVPSPKQRQDADMVPGESAGRRDPEAG